VTTLSEQVKHAYQQPESSPPKTDYISPLQSASDSSEDQLLGINAAYEPRAKGYESNRGGGSSFRAKMHGQGQVNKTAASNYQNLMQPDGNTSSEQSRLDWLLTDAGQLAFISENKLRFLPSFYVPAQVFYQQIKMSGVQQPLLMPVSVKQQNPLVENHVQLMHSLGLDIQLQAGKWILRQVPACIRQLPWMLILPRLMSVKQPFENDQKLLQYICFCWADVHEFVYQELHNWFFSIGQSEQSKLVENYSYCISMPVINGEFDDY
jgi:DNA mismatch repair protein MutL